MDLPVYNPERHWFNLSDVKKPKKEMLDANRFSLFNVYHFNHLSRGTRQWKACWLTSENTVHEKIPTHLKTLSPKLLPGCSIAALGFKPVFKRQKTEGRSGLEFCLEFESKGRQWLPGIFCGVLLNGSDHGVTDLLNDKLHLCVVFDFNRHGQKTIDTSKQYEQFKQQLGQKLKAKDCDWTLIDTKVDPKARLNKWHPLMLLRPMADVFANTCQHDEQVQVFHQTMADIHSMIISLDAFTPLVKELAPVGDL